jgi:hypothetical protein
MIKEQIINHLPFIISLLVAGIISTIVLVKNSIRKKERKIELLHSIQMEMYKNIADWIDRHNVAFDDLQDFTYEQIQEIQGKEKLEIIDITNEIEPIRGENKHLRGERLQRLINEYESI